MFSAGVWSFDGHTKKNASERETLIFSTLAVTKLLHIYIPLEYSHIPVIIACFMTIIMSESIAMRTTGNRRHSDQQGVHIY